MGPQLGKAHHLPPTVDDDEAKCRSLPGGAVSKLRVASNGAVTHGLSA